VHPYPRWFRRVVRTGLPVVLTVTVVLGSWSAVGEAGTSSAPRWPARVDWQRMLEAPTTPVVHPVGVVATSGTVSGATSLIGAGGGLATLTRTSRGPTPSVILDYGHDVGGIPYVTVHSVSGTPFLRISYSEGRQWASSPNGDETPSNSMAGASSRVDSMAVAYPGTLSTGLIQGGERYERIELASPGTVSISSVGIRFTAVRGTASVMRGWFASSSPELNRIWYDGAYTTQLDELPADTAPSPWHISAGVLDAVGGGMGILGQGSDWSDYTMAFDTRAVGAGSGWLVRAQSTFSGYLFLLRTDPTKPESPITLTAVALGPNQFVAIGQAVLPKTFNAARWHHVATTVSGTTMTTSIDGHPVATFDTNAQPAGSPVYGSGTVGFSDIASWTQFRNLVVTGPTGATLFANPLSRASAVDDFSGSGIQTTNALPVMMDGARRDRVVWSGDLGVEVPNIFYTTAASGFVRGSLALLGSYQVASGESGTNVDPTLPLGTFPQSGATYSASYSMDEVDNIATYYLYSGDLGFVRSEWPMITRELAYDASLVDSRGLLATDGTNGQDWDYFDGARTGEVAADNDIYYRTLDSAASTADALGLPLQAASYIQEAADLRTAINRTLFDPSTGLYMESDQMPAAVAQDGNSLAVLFGVVPSGQAGGVLAALARTLPSTPYGPEAFTANSGYLQDVSPFVTNDEVEALFANGDTSAALNLVQKLWGYMDASGPDYSGADWEMVSPHGAPGFGSETSLAHGWSSGATADLSAYVLGVQPMTAGFATWSVQPHTGSLAWVEGDVPTPHGTIAVRWAQDRRSERFAMQVTGPAGTSGTVDVPVAKPGSVVTVRTGGTKTVRVIPAPPGATSVSIVARGGLTYDIDVAPH
jgi:alpha-L-rhamnosidase